MISHSGSTLADEKMCITAIILYSKSFSYYMYRLNLKILGMPQDFCIYSSLIWEINQLLPLVNPFVTMFTHWNRRQNLAKKNSRNLSRGTANWSDHQESSVLKQYLKSFVREYFTSYSWAILVEFILGWVNSSSINNGKLEGICVLPIYHIFFPY